MTKVDVICRRCGRKAPADEFKVDHVYKLAVCKVCYSERRKEIPKKREETTPTLSSLQQSQKDKDKFQSSSQIEKKYEIKGSKLFDDDDDAYLEKAVAKKKEALLKQKENTIHVRPVGDNKVLYPCTKCSYKFKYHIETKKPSKCPYCGKTVDPNISF